MKISYLFGVLLAGCAFIGPGFAQDAARIDMLENQIRELTGQVEELTFSVRQLQKSLDGKQLGAVSAPQEQLQNVPRQKLALAPAAVNDGGIEVIGESLGQQGDNASDAMTTSTAKVAPSAKTLGAMDNAAASSGDDGFQGQVIVPLGDEDGQQDGIEQVALAPVTPQSLFEQSNEALLRRQFPVAEDGFRKLLQTYPDHSLAGSAQYWLGETYYAQGDYRTAAQNFLVGYQKYPKGRRAPDSLLKLGVTLSKMGQKDQACVSLSSVAVEYPKAVEAKKRAQAELKRAGC